MYSTEALEYAAPADPDPRRGASQPIDLIQNTTTPMLLDLMSVRLNPDKAGAGSVAVDPGLPRQGRFRVTVMNDVQAYKGRSERRQGGRGDDHAAGRVR